MAISFEQPIAGATIEDLRAEAVEAVGLWEGLRGDIAVNVGEAEGMLGRLETWLRALVNPSVRLCLLLRLGSRAPRRTRWLWRNLAITLHHSEIQPGAILEPGLRLPVPIGLAIGSTVHTAPGVTIENRVSFATRTESGTLSPRRTTIGAGAMILTSTTMIGGVRVGEGAVVGPHAFVTHRVKPGQHTEPHARH